MNKLDEFVKEHHLYMAEEEGRCVICGKEIVPWQASGIVYEYEGGQAHAFCLYDKLESKELKMKRELERVIREEGGKRMKTYDVNNPLVIYDCTIQCELSYDCQGDPRKSGLRYRLTKLLKEFRNGEADLYSIRGVDIKIRKTWPPKPSKGECIW